MRRKVLFISLLLLCLHSLQAQQNSLLPGFTFRQSTDEWLRHTVTSAGIRLLINVPASFNSVLPTRLIIYTLPNGNSIEWTEGKHVSEGDDWHFGIQQVGAQVRWLRDKETTTNLVIAYAEAPGKSFPAWKRTVNAPGKYFREVIASVSDLLTGIQEISLLSHSGGGSIMFSYLEEEEPDPRIVRIAFLDSNYGYKSLHAKLFQALQQKHSPVSVVVLAYNDSLVEYNGKRIVSDTGGTWYRSRLMIRDLPESAEMYDRSNDSMIVLQSIDKKLSFYLHRNREKLIYHTVQVERNGVIHAMLAGTPMEEKEYRYFGEAVYGDFIREEVKSPYPLMVPISVKAKSPVPYNEIFSQLPGNKEFLASSMELLKSGEVPARSVSMVPIHKIAPDRDGVQHDVTYFVARDYLAAGDDTSYCRVPLDFPRAVEIASLYGAVLPTRLMVNEIFESAGCRTVPYPLKPSEDQYEKLQQALLHSQIVDSLISLCGDIVGGIRAGMKKDVILSCLLNDTAYANRQVIYGWHYPDGKVIQNRTAVHGSKYTDYSHGIRLVHSQAILNGTLTPIVNILTDPVLFRLLSDEEEPIKKPVLERTGFVK